MCAPPTRAGTCSRGQRRGARSRTSALDVASGRQGLPRAERRGARSTGAVHARRGGSVDAPTTAPPDLVTESTGRTTPRYHRPVTESKIIYTHTDEAPALATYSFLPIIRAFAGAAGHRRRDPRHLPRRAGSCRSSPTTSPPTKQIRRRPRRAGATRHHSRGQHHQAPPTSRRRRRS